MDEQPKYLSQDEAMRAAAAVSYEEEEKKTLSVVSLVFGILSILTLCCCGSIVVAPVGLLLSIIALARKKAGKNLAITGTVLCSISMLVTVGMLILLSPIFSHSEEIAEDYTHLVMEQDEVFAAYKADKSLPDYLKKYTEPPYSDYLEGKLSVSFYTIMDTLLQQYEAGKFTKPEELKGTPYYHDENGQTAVSQSDTVFLPVY